MATILSSDVIFATIRQRGQIMATIRLSGITCLSDLLSRIRGAFHGLATIDLRNGTQGWQSRHTIMMPAA